MSLNKWVIVCGECVLPRFHLWVLFPAFAHAVVLHHLQMILFLNRILLTTLLVHLFLCVNVGSVPPVGHVMLCIAPLVTYFLHQSCNISFCIPCGRIDTTSSRMRLIMQADMSRYFRSSCVTDPTWLNPMQYIVVLPDRKAEYLPG